MRWEEDVDAFGWLVGPSALVGSVFLIFTNDSEFRLLMLSGLGDLYVVYEDHEIAPNQDT